MLKLCKFWTRANAVRPYSYLGKSYLRKIAPLFAYLRFAMGQKSGADLILRYLFHLISDFYMLFFIKSAPCRLAPNEALPHTPLGALPLDPTSPLAPGLSVRFISRFARCFILLYACNLLWSAMLIPHSSLLIPHSSLLIPHSSLLT